MSNQNRRLTAVALMVTFYVAPCVAEDGWHIGGMVGVGTASQSTAQRHTEWAYGGYGVTDWLDIGLGVSVIGATNQNAISVKPALYNRAKYPLSQEDSLYAGLGVRGVDSLSAEVGWLHRLSDPLSLNIGYRYQHQPFKVEEGDLYTLAIGLEWRWHSKSVVASITNDEVETIIRPVSESNASNLAIAQHEEPDLLALGDEHCPAVKDVPLEATEAEFTRSYTIVPGDWASKIAPAHCVTLAWLEAMNPWLAERNAQEAYIFPGETLRVPR
ncbi:hypothetical protein [Vibrio sp. WXL103]|uniref:hypothetical protein n=1 Tax=Vibrio sp. WXL103 TaxID=3450710 RepID=UPI003EC89C9A